MAKGRTSAGKASSAPRLEKAPSGISGLDEVTGGGLPRGRPTLICGGPGCGKSLFGVEFLVRGILQYGEPGALITFEEAPGEIAQNVASLGFNLPDLVRRNRLALEHIHVERNQIEEAGDYNLDGLFLRIGLAVDAVGAKRIVLDTLESLFSGFANQAVLRAELRRLFRWLKDRGLTAVITGERGDSVLTRQGLEEYVSDCVILLDHRVEEQLSTRRLRVVKYRGTLHGTNEYPFLIDEDGITVMPITSVGLQHEASRERISSGVSKLDEMLGGKGYYRGSSILISGTAGTGKSSLAGHFARSTGRAGERCIYFAFEESPSQIMRNMNSIGVELEPLVRKDLLRFDASRSTRFGLEMHLATIIKRVLEFRPAVVIIDPITNFLTRGRADEVLAMLTRLVDFFKLHGITAVYTSLTHGGDALEASAGISSIMDTWILLRDIELGGERNRGLYVLKSRGMPHSNQIREFVLTDHGIELLDAYMGPAGTLTGSARVAQEARDTAERMASQRELEAGRREIQRRRTALEAQMTALRLELEAQDVELQRLSQESAENDAVLRANRSALARSRRAVPAVTSNGAEKRRRKGSR